MQHDIDGGRSGKRFKLKVRHVLLGIPLALLAMAVLHMALLSSGASKRIQALRAAGQPTSLAELAQINKLPMGMENGASIYENAFAAFVPPGDANLPFIGKQTVSLPRGTAPAGPMAEAIAEYLVANKECLTRLREAAGVEVCRYDYDYRQGCPHLSTIRNCAQLLKLAAVDSACKGDANAAVASMKDSLALGNSLSHEPLFISYLVHIACTGLTLTSLEYVMSSTPLTEAQLRDLDDALAATSGGIDLARALATERCSLLDCVRDPSMAGIQGMGASVLKLPGIRSQGVIDLLDYMDDCIAAAGLPEPQRAARFKEIEAHFSGLSALHIVAKIMAPALMRISQLDSRARVHLDLAGTGLAIERYRLANGKLPEQLTDLVPAYMERVAIDPFDGRPIRYRRTEPGYVLWSISDDGQDNGGKDRDEVGKGQPFDLCFAVTR